MDGPSNKTVLIEVPRHTCKYCMIKIPPSSMAKSANREQRNWFWCPSLAMVTSFYGRFLNKQQLTTKQLITLMVALYAIFFCYMCMLWFCFWKFQSRNYICFEMFRLFGDNHLSREIFTHMETLLLPMKGYILDPCFVLIALEHWQLFSVQ